MSGAIRRSLAGLRDYSMRVTYDRQACRPDECFWVMEKCLRLVGKWRQSVGDTRSSVTTAKVTVRCTCTTAFRCAHRWTRAVKVVDGVAFQTLSPNKQTPDATTTVVATEEEKEGSFRTATAGQKSSSIERAVGKQGNLN